jgi:hypothetical protein
LDKKKVVEVITEDGRLHEVTLEVKNANDRLCYETSVFISKLIHQYGLNNSQGQYLVATIIHFLFPTLLSSKQLEKKVADLAALVKKEYPDGNNE